MGDTTGQAVRPRGRWLAFRLRTMFVWVTLVGAFLGWNLHHVRMREGLLKRPGVFSYGSSPTPASQKQLPWLWSVFGARHVGQIQLPPDEFTQEDLFVFEAEFPEADVRRIPVLDQSSGDF